MRVFPLTALDSAYRIPVVVKTLVDRPRHVAIVNGLKRNLASQIRYSTRRDIAYYHAATETPSHLICFRNAENNLPETACPESEIVIKAFAFIRSINE